MAKKIKENHPLRLIRWANDGYPPIDFYNEGKAIIKLIRDYQSIEQENKALKEKNKQLVELQNNFYMNVCRAYNAGKQNQVNIVLAKGSSDEDKMFLSSHDYFKTEFPEFKTNVP